MKVNIRLCFQLNEFAITPEDMVVGIGRYNRRFDTKTEVAFGDYKNYSELKAKINSIPYDGSGKCDSALFCALVI